MIAVAAYRLASTHPLAPVAPLAPTPKAPYAPYAPYALLVPVCRGGPVRVYCPGRRGRVDPAAVSVIRRQRLYVLANPRDLPDGSCHRRRDRIIVGSADRAAVDRPGLGAARSGDRDCRGRVVNRQRAAAVAADEAVPPGGPWLPRITNRLRCVPLRRRDAARHDLVGRQFPARDRGYSLSRERAGPTRERGRRCGHQRPQHRRRAGRRRCRDARVDSGVRQPVRPADARRERCGERSDGLLVDAADPPPKPGDPPPEGGGYSG